jgi:hypothetical protein
MAMTADEFSTPLGLDRKRKAPFQLAVHQAAIAASAILALIFLASALMAHKPLGSEGASKPHATVAASTPAKKPDPSGAGSAALDAIGDTRDSHPAAPVPAALPTRTVTIIDGTSGKRQEVAIPAWTESSGTDIPAIETPRRTPAAKPPSRTGSKAN